MTGAAIKAPPAAKAEAGVLDRSGPFTHSWVYLWHWPIRVMHWIAAVAIVALIVTGFYIGRPYFMTGTASGESFAMGWMRFIHFLSAGVLVATGIIRVYWLIVGNKFERWSSLIPWHVGDWVNAWRVLKKYMLIYPERAPHFLGHNPLQQMSYTALYAVVLIQIVTGFAMYGQANPGGFFYTLFGWVVPLLGGIQLIHFVHHVLTWLFIIFIPVHIYFTVRADALHREGRVSSMITGGRFVRRDVEYVDE